MEKQKIQKSIENCTNHNVILNEDCVERRIIEEFVEL